MTKWICSRMATTCPRPPSWNRRPFWMPQVSSFQTNHKSLKKQRSATFTIQSVTNVSGLMNHLEAKLCLKWSLLSYYILQNFIRRCLAYNKEHRPDVLTLCNDPYLLPKRFSAPVTTTTTNGTWLSATFIVSWTHLKPLHIILLINTLLQSIKRNTPLRCITWCISHEIWTASFLCWGLHSLADSECERFWSFLAGWEGFRSSSSLGFEYFAWIQTRYILSCFPLLICSRLSTYSCSCFSPAPDSSSSTSSKHIMLSYQELPDNGMQQSLPSVKKYTRVPSPRT